MGHFKAVVIEKNANGENGHSVALKDFDEAGFMDGDVTVRIAYSSLNYKDGLAITGASPVVRRFPMIPGIDFAGIVENSANPAFKAGDKVLLNGWGTGETHLGAYGEKTKVKGSWLIHLPEGLSMLDAMTIGTAGYTAMLSVMALENYGLSSEQGRVVVSGASGGVGSVALMLLAAKGWSVEAVTGRPEEADYLHSLGAETVLPRQEFSAPGRPLGKERWIAGIDTAGSHVLANMLAQTAYGGAVASCGLAAGMDLPTTVMPFILRGVALLGIDSVMCPLDKRKRAWTALAGSLDYTKLQAMRSIISLDQVIQAGHDILAGKIRGRTVIAIDPSIDA